MINYFSKTAFVSGMALEKDGAINHLKHSCLPAESKISHFEPLDPSVNVMPNYNSM